MAAAALGIAWAAANGVAAHEGDPTIRLDPATVAPGGGILVTGQGFEHGLTVHLVVQSVDAGIQVGEVTVDDAGSFERVVALPAGLSPGVYGVRVEAEDALIANDVLVIDPSAGPGRRVDPAIPPLAIGLGIGGLAVLLVVVLRLAGRRSVRQSHTEASRG
jgi:hypothetical protein